MHSSNLYWLSLMFFPMYVGIAWLAVDLLKIEDLLSLRRSFVYATLAAALSVPYYFVERIGLGFLLRGGEPILYALEVALGTLVLAWAFQLSVNRPGMKAYEGCLTSIIVGFLSACVFIGANTLFLFPSK